jgi:hypothetical protein
LETDLNNMTMRDLFAAFILAGMIASDKELIFYQDKLTYTHEAYDWADHLVRAFTYGK